MKFIDELVDYFADLLTEEQKREIARFWHPVPDYGKDDECDEYDEYDEYGKNEDMQYPYEDYDTLYDLPARRGSSGHSGGKRRPLRHPAFSAEQLVSIFQAKVRKAWNVDLSLRLLRALAAVVDSGSPPRQSKIRIRRRFELAVDSLKELDEAALASRLSLLYRRCREEEGPDRGLFRDLFYACISVEAGEGPDAPKKLGIDCRLSPLAEDFCREKVYGIAANAVQRTLRNTAWPEKKQTEENTNLFAPFLEVRELVVIFDYYRLLRKLEYVLSQALCQAVEKAERYGVDPCRFQPKL